MRRVSSARANKLAAHVASDTIFPHHMINNAILNTFFYFRKSEEIARACRS